MAEKTLYPGVAIPAHFEYQNSLGRILNQKRLPEVLKNGKWETVDDPVKFQQESHRLTEAEFNEELAAAK